MVMDPPLHERAEVGDNAMAEAAVGTIEKTDPRVCFFIVPR